jgi:hypothetical protein
MNHPNSRHGHEDEPGHRNGEGSESIVPHMQRQQQSQVQMPNKKLRRTDSAGSDSAGAEVDDSQ